MRVSLLGLLVAAAPWMGGCEDFDPCSESDDTRACECSDGRVGVQACLPERIWDDCVCSGLSLPDGGLPATPEPPPAVTPPDAPAGDGDGDTTSDGDGDTTGDGDGDTAGDGDGDGDGDTTGDGDGDTTGDGDGDTAGDGDGDTAGDGDGDTAGDGDGDTSSVDAYSTCDTDADCTVTDSMCMTDVLSGNAICSPPCNSVADCPPGQGSFEATPECNLGRCSFNCTPVDLITPRTCPTGAACVVGLLSATCYAE